MSHIAEVYAKELGVKIGRPQITEQIVILRYIRQIKCPLLFINTGILFCGY